MTTERMRAYRILTGRTRRITVHAALIGHLWADGGTTTRTLLSTGLDPQLLDACHTVAVQGPLPTVGSGHSLEYGNRPGRPKASPRPDNPVLVRELLAQGRTPQYVAWRLELSESYVYRLIRKWRANDDDCVVTTEGVVR